MSDDQRGHTAWRWAAASVLGKHHRDCGLPNQDSVHVATSASGEVVCAAVSDGAGSAARAEEGSRLAASRIASCLCDFGEALEARVTTPDEVRAAVGRAIEQVRDELSPDGLQLRDFHCTCVAWLSLPTGTYVARIGDSAALSTRFAGPDDGAGEVDFFPDGGYALHAPERGEYANETCFLTEDGWRAQLVVTEVDPEADAVLLMSDGALDVGLQRGAVYRGFLSSVVGMLLEVEDDAVSGRTLGAWLAAPQTYKLTGDDKTIFAAVRRSRAAECAGRPIRFAATAPVEEARPLQVPAAADLPTGSMAG